MSAGAKNKIHTGSHFTINKKSKKRVHTGTRARNLLLRRQAPYPLGHTDMTYILRTTDLNTSIHPLVFQTEPVPPYTYTHLPTTHNTQHTHTHTHTHIQAGKNKKSPRRDSNPQPPDPKSDALSIAPLGRPLSKSVHTTAQKGTTWQAGCSGTSTWRDPLQIGESLPLLSDTTISTVIHRFSSEHRS